MEMYIVTHKKFSPPNKEGYIPIQVGKEFTGTDLGFLSDSTGENIAQKNESYCELTAQYWMWKNVSEKGNIGLCHYRRYFTMNPFSANSKYFLSNKDIDKLLQNYDIILPQKLKMEISVEEKYSSSEAGFQHDLDRLRSLIYNEYSEYSDAFERVMKSNTQYYWNMFVMPFESFDEYSSWLFDILFKYEKMTDLTGYDVRQKRIYGYLSERLLNVWVIYKNLNVYECPVVQTDKNSFDIVKGALGTILRKAK